MGIAKCFDRGVSWGYFEMILHWKKTRLKICPVFNEQSVFGDM